MEISVKMQVPIYLISSFYQIVGPSYKYKNEKRCQKRIIEANQAKLITKTDILNFSLDASPTET